METVRSFDEIVVAYGMAVRRMCAAYADDGDDREDLFQEMLLGIWRALPGFRNECSERTFIFRIAHNRGVTFATRRRRHLSLEEVSLFADPRADPAEEASRALRRERLLTAVRRLPHAQREAVLLYLEGLSQREIAEVQGATENNIGVRLSRARTALRAMLGDGDDFG
ncbi:MAG TPA: RNA polymerase sigma factor [Gemmatimonadaceae bacterium]|jgi:RNA polymerase sigma-70 factor (ECF subfamily)